MSLGSSPSNWPNLSSIWSKRSSLGGSPSLEAKTMNFPFWVFRDKERVLVLVLVLEVNKRILVKEELVLVAALVRPIRPSIASE